MFIRQRFSLLKDSKYSSISKVSDDVILHLCLFSWVPISSFVEQAGPDVNSVDARVLISEWTPVILISLTCPKSSLSNAGIVSRLSPLIFF
jgi:hypothetical protein